MENKITPIIGLEVHVELKTKTKMFCSCPTDHFGAKPNTQVCPVSLGLPGSLPFPNKQAIDWAALAGLALNCEINLFSKFDRKNYFYPDLPKGYQISQYDLPIAQNGQWKSEDGKIVRIRRVHLEEDTGKLIHEEGETLIDFNRAGVPLVEIVTEPDFDSSEETKEFLQKLQQIIQYLGISDANMEKGQMRCEPNVNLKIEENGEFFYTAITEIKNVNSFRFVQKAIEYEIQRQKEEFEKSRITKENGSKQTRGWDEKSQATVPQRVKEEAADYRYFPEPDIPPIKWTEKDIQTLKDQLPKLPNERKQELINKYGINETAAEILIQTQEKADYYEVTAELGQKEGIEAHQIANLIINKKVDSSKFTPEEFVKEVKTKKQKTEIGESELKEILEQIIANNTETVNDYKRGKEAALEYLVGQTAKETKGQANPNKVRELLKNKLK